MCQKCEPARKAAEKVALDMADPCCSAEITRNFYRKQGVDAERERIIELLEEYYDDLLLDVIALIKGENK